MKKEQKKITLGVTLGDPNGIGPELALKVFSDKRMLDLCVPVIYGSGRALNYYKQLLRFERFNYHLIHGANQLNPRKINLMEVDKTFDRAEPGKPTEKAGALAFKALEAATEDLREGDIQALVTLPINKASIQQDGFNFPGHTEYLAEKFSSTQPLMLMASERLRVAVATGHIPLKDVAGKLNQKMLKQKIGLLYETLRLDFNIAKPKIAVLGLNPHAGDEGLLGAEDKEIIKPVIDELRSGRNSRLIMGPYPADGFFASGQYAKFDGVLAMYHDQGLIPFKTICGQNGVNYTAGLNVIRTSPDHGTAFDIAGQNKADPSSFLQAIYMAIDVYRTRVDNLSIRAGAMQQISMDEFLLGEDETVTAEEAEDDL